MRRLTRCVAVGASVAAVVGGMAVPAQASTWQHHMVVKPGQSIQKAIDRAHEHTVITVRPGTYWESLSITKNDITIRAYGATLRQPSKPGNSLCNQMGGGAITGICVVGDIQLPSDPQGQPVVLSNVRDTHIMGFTIDRFSGDGIFGFATDGMRIEGTHLQRNGGYGVFSNTSTQTSYVHNVSSHNGDAGFYIGDSPQALSEVVGNLSTGNRAEGLLLRDASYGVVADNRFVENCAGVLVLADAPGPAVGWTLVRNRVSDNDTFCPGDPADGEPPFSGIGIALVGAASTVVYGNHVWGNHPGGTSAVPPAGILVMSGFSGTAPMNDIVSHNTVTNNRPVDIFYDHTGTVRFVDNRCHTSNTSRMCRR